MLLNHIPSGFYVMCARASACVHLCVCVCVCVSVCVCVCVCYNCEVFDPFLYIMARSFMTCLQNLSIEITRKSHIRGTQPSRCIRSFKPFIENRPRGFFFFFFFFFFVCFFFFFFFFFFCSTQLSMKFVLLINFKLLITANSFLLNIAEHEHFYANKCENANYLAFSDLLEE